MKDYVKRIKRAKDAIENAEYILIGAGAGLSDAAEIKYSGKRFTDRFSDFIDKYDMKDLYSAGFYLFETIEEKWAYWARHIFVNRFEVGSTPLYEKLHNLVKDKKYFVLTTNVDHQFWLNGFKDEKIFATQGDYGNIQCSKACHNRVYDDEKIVLEILKNTKDCKIPSELVPKCPVCGGEMDVNLRKDEYFVQDEAWDKAFDSYNNFLSEVNNKNIVLLELGVGFNTPGIIRYPFENMTYGNKNATLIRLNKDYPNGIEENKKQTISFDEDIENVIDDLYKK